MSERERPGIGPDLSRPPMPNPPDLSLSEPASAEQLEVSRQTAGELAALRAEAKADSAAAGRLARWSLVVALLTLLVSIAALVVAICAANG